MFERVPDPGFKLLARGGGADGGCPVTRIADTFARIRREGRPGLVTYTTAADPDLARSGAILETLDRAGADIIEVGVPFSDPLADGPVIQRATERALAAGGSLRNTLSLIADVRPRVAAPVVVFTYANPLLRMGVEPFAATAAASGVDSSTKGISATYSVQLLFSVPPVGSDEKVVLLGFTQGLTAASEVQ